MIKYNQYDIVFQEVPDETALIFSITNCPYRCNNCHSPHLRNDIGKDLEKDYLEIIEKYKDMITCVCFMGGDSSLNVVRDLFHNIKIKHPNLKTCLYSGSNSLFDIIPYTNFIRYFDYIKIGSYKEDLGGLDNVKTNQRFYKINNELDIRDKNCIEDITYKFQERKGI